MLPGVVFDGVEEPGDAPGGTARPVLRDPSRPPKALFRATQALLKTSLGYPPVAGTPELQALVAKWHGAQPDDVLVTVGCSEVRA
jgi:aspartate/methionine/tyrosine aminotransferase